MYYGARYYDPAIGRFMGIDPAPVNPNNPHSFNRYVYANNNPYRYVDPDGREVVSSNAANNEAIVKYISNLATGKFEFDKNNKLVMDSETGGKGKSDTYTKKLKFAIEHEARITINLDTTENSKSRINTTYREGDPNSTVNTNNNIIGLEGFSGIIKGTPDTNLAHELVEHAIPNLTGEDKGNTAPAFMENVIRRQNGLPRRTGEDHY